MARSLLCLVGLLILVVSMGTAYRLWTARKSGVATEASARQSQQAAGPRVRVVTVGAPPPAREVTLLGEAVPFLSATLYAKVSGYLKSIAVDKGDRVTANQVLAVIESPELDRQYEGAVADARNKRTNAQRADTLVARDMISKQEADQAEADAEVAEATVSQLAAQKTYEIIRAPFAGTVVARYADPGALVQGATQSQTAALPVVTVADTRVLRVYVYPDQSDAHFIRVSDPAEIMLPEEPNVHLRAAVTRMSRQLDSKTRTMLTEIDFQNQNDVILPGSFVRVTLKIHQPASGALTIPSEGLVMRGSKPFAAVVSAGNEVHFRPIVIGLDEGPVVRIASGLSKGDRIALNLGENVLGGSKIQPVRSGGKD
ncbi:MAG: efflux RND transporter periplasmic adaptor subunit [Acidobacteriia bacterium]|nr:efflux RND transporter periplasmic adaptor subunit [Terriglobia bacterium]